MNKIPWFQSPPMSFPMDFWKFPAIFDPVVPPRCLQVQQEMQEFLRAKL